MNPDIIARIAESKIQEAVEEGKFDNLPGKGKPIVFEEDSSVPLSVRLANKVLKNAGVLPEWIQVQKDIEAERREAVALRERLIQEHQKHFTRLCALPAEHAEVQRFAAWHAKSRASYLRRLKNVNSSLLKLALMGPASAQSGIPIKINAETAAFDEQFPPLPHQVPVAPPAETPAQSGRIKSIARERYQAGESAGPTRD